MSLEFNEIKKLTELFQPKRNNSDSEDETEDCSDNKVCTGDDGDETNTIKKVNPYSKIERNKNMKQLLESDDVQAILDEDDADIKCNKDWKKTPVWDITYKQSVSTSDIFLQMGFKNPTTASCEDMIVSVNLPGDSYYNIDLKIQTHDLILVSPTYYLNLRLPHPVDPQRGNAKWDKETEKLIVTLRMDRELDLINF